MKRKDFLKTIGIGGLLIANPIRSKALENNKNEIQECVLTPSETAGPFPLDLTDNNFFLRQDIRENEPGTDLRMRIRIIDDQTCEPMRNVRVHIWHCSHEGFYSGYDVSTNPGQDGLTYLRGYQVTDNNGEVEFLTVFPGWYTGRICHIHVQVYVSSQYSAVSQYTFEPVTRNQIYLENTSDYKKGVDPLDIDQDFAFSDSSEGQVASLQKEEDGLYSSFIELVVRGQDSVGIGHTERQNAEQFSMGQNFPNPFIDKCTIPYSLKHYSDVTFEIWDINGNKLDEIKLGGRSEGDHQQVIDLNSLNLSKGNYLVQLIVKNHNGVFKDMMLMTNGG